MNLMQRSILWSSTGRSYGPETHAKLDQWVQAKRAGDFETSDRLRKELRAEGVNPDDVRPDRARGAGTSIIYELLTKGCNIVLLSSRATH